MKSPTTITWYKNRDILPKLWKTITCRHRWYSNMWSRDTIIVGIYGYVPVQQHLLFWLLCHFQDSFYTYYSFSPLVLQLILLWEKKCFHSKFPKNKHQILEVFFSKTLVLKGPVYFKILTFKNMCGKYLKKKKKNRSSPPLLFFLIHFQTINNNPFTQIGLLHLNSPYNLWKI